MQLLEHFYADDSHLLYLYVNSLVGPLQEIISKLLWNIIKRQPVKGKPRFCSAAVKVQSTVTELRTGHHTMIRPYMFPTVCASLDTHHKTSDKMRIQLKYPDTERRVDPL